MTKRLKTLPGRIATLPSALCGAGGTGGAAERPGRHLGPGRKWYKTAKWRALRELVIKRAGGVCEQTGVLLVGSRHAPNSPVVDHKVPHRGDRDLFFDPDNLQLVSKEWHDREKQRQERSQYGGVG